MTLGGHEGDRGDEYKRLLRQEELILDVTERLSGALMDHAVSRTELARRLGRTPGFVSQVLSGSRNLTLRTIADIAAALTLEPTFRLLPERTPAPAEPEIEIGVHEEHVGRWVRWEPQLAETAQPVHTYAPRGSRSGRRSLATAA